eukprot:1637224-Rhodomonas_salina.1
MGQFCRRRRKHVGLAHTGPTALHFNLLSNRPIDICGKIALTAGEAELDLIDVEFQLLCNTMFANSVLTAKAAKLGPMAIAKGCAALLLQREGKSANINLLASYRRAHSTVWAGAAAEGARANGSAAALQHAHQRVGYHPADLWVRFTEAKLAVLQARSVGKDQAEQLQTLMAALSSSQASVRMTEEATAEMQAKIEEAER